MLPSFCDPETLRIFRSERVADTIEGDAEECHGQHTPERLRVGSDSAFLPRRQPPQADVYVTGIADRFQGMQEFFIEPPRKGPIPSRFAPDRVDLAARIGWARDPVYPPAP